MESVDFPLAPLALGATARYLSRGGYSTDVDTQDQ